MKTTALLSAVALAFLATGCAHIYDYNNCNIRMDDERGDGRWGYLGYECYDLTPQQLDSRREGLDHGVGVWSAHGKAAAEMDLRPGDVILEVNGENACNSAQVYRITRAISPGGSVSLLVLRDGGEVLLMGRTRPSPVQRENSFEVEFGIPEKFHWLDLVPIWVEPGYFRIGPKFASLFEYDGGEHPWEGAGYRYLFFYSRRTRVDVDGIHKVPE